MSGKINVLLVDDHAVVRMGFKTYLGTSERIGQVFEVDRGEKACQLYDQLKPDIVVLDLSMPGIGGFECIRRLINRDPNCKILVFSIHDELIYVSRALKAGAKGYLVKSSEPEMLMNAVFAIMEGGNFLTPELAQKLAVGAANETPPEEKIKQLTPREFDIFYLLAHGATTREVAAHLCLSHKTVCNNATSIKEKLGLKTMSELALFASRHGIVKHVA
ncbi:response regulator transcription factor [Methylomonas rapida]|uniref:Response regulator transcription factor n=1 Tax=Methylomonas rapida TaxID=2963939 RepID=A0ABY7GL26_9GAMM|nr:response regulator transcription factor [Methylomonas rapida]WAR45189.1 response regulator transcription factor [Methylomonas rapida]